MKARSLVRVFAVVLLAVIPSVTLAEVSVKLDHKGRLRKVIYRTREKGPSPVIWGQVRRYLPLRVLLNPLGDNLGDLPPMIVLHPETGHPWVVWSRNIANQKRIGFAMWDGEAWTEPSLVVATPDPMGYDALDPFLTFDRSGAAYLVWWVDAPVAKIYFSTLYRGSWTPPLQVSDPTVDSRRPSLVIDGPDATLVYETPSGQSFHLLGAHELVEAANNLMDSPIPPGNQPGPGGEPGGGSDTGDDRFIKK
jgi:hypothetical protein